MPPGKLSLIAQIFSFDEDSLDNRLSIDIGSCLIINGGWVDSLWIYEISSLVL